MKVKALAFCALVIIAFSCSSRKEIIDKCDIVRTEYETNQTIVPLFIGNGRFGGMISSSGLQLHAEESSPYARRNYLFHMQRTLRAKYNSDYLAAVAKIYWRDTLTNVTKYRQHQHYYDGTISTSFTDNAGAVKVLTWFDAIERDITFYEISSESAREIVIDYVPEVPVHYGLTLSQNADIKDLGKSWEIKTTSPYGDFCFYVNSGFDGRVEDGKLILTAKGKSFVSISCKHESLTKPSVSLRRTAKFWKDKWENIPFVEFGKEDEQKVFVRGTAQILSNFNDDGLGLAPPMGLTGNEWSFAFPQDISFIHPVLLTLGQKDEARTIIEYFGNQIPGLEEYTRRLVNAEGIFCPWAMSYKTLKDYHSPTPPNYYYYETHNSGYLCRMAYETALMLDDPQWTEKFAYPLIKGCAVFYKSVSYKGEDGYWHVKMTPGMGQNEYGGFNQSDYLCSLYSAKYCFEKAVECGLDEDGCFAEILEDSLAFNAIKDPAGYYYGNLGSGPEDYGKQKHPVQLNSIAYLPTHNGIGPEETYAYKHRYDITNKANVPFFYGWTLGEFILASARMQDRDGWQKDWDNIQLSVYADPDFIQFYETSTNKVTSYYVTTTGLMLQSLLCNLVNDWTGDLKIAGCIPPSWTNPIKLKGIYSKLGVTVSGTIFGQGEYSVTLEAWKDCDIVVDGQAVSLKKGQKYNIATNGPLPS